MWFDVEIKFSNIPEEVVDIELAKKIIYEKLKEANLKWQTGTPVPTINAIFSKNEFTEDKQVVVLIKELSDDTKLRKSQNLAKSIGRLLSYIEGMKDETQCNAISVYVQKFKAHIAQSSYLIMR